MRKFGKTAMELAPLLDYYGYRIVSHRDVETRRLTGEWGAAIMPSLQDTWWQQTTTIDLEGFLSERKLPTAQLVVVLERHGFIVDYATETIRTNNRPSVSLFDGLVGVENGMIEDNLELRIVELYEEKPR